MQRDSLLALYVCVLLMLFFLSFFFFNDTATPEIYTLSLHDALPIFDLKAQHRALRDELQAAVARVLDSAQFVLGDERSEEHTSELQSPMYLVCRLLLEKKKNKAHRTRRQ